MIKIFTNQESENIICNSNIAIKTSKTFNPSKNYELAEKHLNGDGVPVDFEEAEKYAQRAIRDLDPEGHKIMGDIIIKGPIIYSDGPRPSPECPPNALNIPLSREKYEDAIERGSVMAYESLGDMYAENCFLYFRVSKADQEALRLYKIGAENGVASCIRKIGDMHIRGQGVDMNIMQGVALYEQAIEQGDKKAAEKLGDMYYSGEVIPANIDKAMEAFAKSNSPAAIAKLGFIHYNGENGEENKSEAAKCFDKAAKLGDTRSKFILALMLDKGDGINEDKQEAAKLYGELAKTGHTSSQYNLGLMLLSGDGVSLNKQEAANLFKSASDEGHNKAAYKLGVMMFDGDGIKQDKESGLKLIKDSAESGNKNAKDFMKKIDKQKSNDDKGHSLG